MDGSQILLARRAARVTQEELAEALDLVHRGTLTDIESGAVEVTDAWVYKAVTAIDRLKAERSEQAA